MQSRLLMSLSLCILACVTTWTATAQQSAAAPAVFATSAVPNLINYSGTLVLSSSPDAATFAIYRQQDGGAPLWLKTQNVMPYLTGRYTVLLGNTKPE